MIKRVLTIAIVVAAGVGFLVASGLVVDRFTSKAACPAIGPMPLCVAVLAGYGAILVSFIVKGAWRARVFYLGLAPVLGLAIVGVASELVIGETCPRTASGIPKCYYSFALAATILTMELIKSRTTAQSEVSGKRITK